MSISYYINLPTCWSKSITLKQKGDKVWNGGRIYICFNTCSVASACRYKHFYLKNTLLLWHKTPSNTLTLSLSETPSVATLSFYHLSFSLSFYHLSFSLSLSLSLSLSCSSFMSNSESWDSPLLLLFCERESRQREREWESVTPFFARSWLCIHGISL